MSAGASVLVESSRFHPQDAGGWKPGLAMALFVHLLLVGALALGVHWKIQQPAAVEAEVWTEVPKAQVEPLPTPVTPAEVPTPTPAEPEPQPVTPPQVKPPDIVIAPEKPKLDKPVKKKEPKEVFLPDPPKKAKPEPQKPEPKKPEPKKPELKADKPPAKPVVDAKAEARAKAEAAAQAKADAAKLAEQRRANLDRLMRNLAKDQIASAGPSDSYIGRIVSRVKANIVFPRDGVVGNPAALVRVECTAEGKITRSTVLITSGNEQWDQAVLRALERTQVLPLDEHKRSPCPFEINFRPQDF